MKLPFELLSFGPPALILVGFVLLWATSRTLRSGQEPGASVVNIALRCTGWSLMLFGVFAIVGLMSHVLFIFAWFATASVIGATAHRFRNAERQSLLWGLMVAAERGIPLEAAARAFAYEHNDLVGRRALHLADYLEAGVPLSLAMRRLGHPLPPAAQLAADLGQQTGALGPALRQVVDQMDEFDATLRSLLEKLFYLVFLVFWAIAMLTFMMVKIVPVFTRIMYEFDMEMPPISHALIAISAIATQAWFVVIPLLLLLLTLVVGGVLYYVGLTPRTWPGIRLIWWRADCALVLRWLAIAVRQSRPIVDVIRLLASYFPHSRLRAKLDWIAKRVDKGGDWSESLWRAGLIKRTESIVFKSAERAGNLAWALDEMADSGVRRAAYRLRAFISVAFPVVLLVFGGCVLFIAVGVLMPLFSLIQGLS